MKLATGTELATNKRNDYTDNRLIHYWKATRKQVI